MRSNRRSWPSRWSAAGAVAALLLAAPAAPAFAQNPAGKDEALEKLLEKLEGPKPDSPKPGEADQKPGDTAKKPDPKPDSKPAADPGKKDSELEKLLEKLEGPKPAPDAPKAEPGQPGSTDKKPGDAAKPGESAKPAPPSGEVAGKDESLDKLLEGLGGTEDKPTAEGKKPQPPGGAGDESKPDQPPPPGGQGGEPKDQERPLDRGEQNLDQRLEELTGRKPKKQDGDKKQQGQGQGQGQGGQGEGEGEDQGPLGDLIKQMREVEERLGKPDTGSETRQRQSEIVKNLDTLLEQARNGGGQGKSMLAKGQGKPGGNQPSGQKGDQPGAQGVGASKPTPPRTPPAPVELAKAVWGQLPASVRDDMNNVLKESPLPSKADMIRLYYLSLGKKSTSGGN